MATFDTATFTTDRNTARDPLVAETLGWTAERRHIRTPWAPNPAEKYHVLAAEVDVKYKHQRPPKDDRQLAARKLDMSYRRAIAEAKKEHHISLGAVRTVAAMYRDALAVAERKHQDSVEKRQSWAELNGPPEVLVLVQALDTDYRTTIAQLEKRRLQIVDEVNQQLEQKHVAAAKTLDKIQHSAVRACEESHRGGPAQKSRRNMKKQPGLLVKGGKV